MYSYPLHRMCFGQYQASSAALEWSGVTGRWRLLSHAQNAVRWLALSKRSVEALRRHLLSMSACKLPMQQFTNAASYQRSKLPTQQVTNAAIYQRSKLLTQQVTNAASYQCSKLPILADKLSINILHACEWLCITARPCNLELLPCIGIKRI